MRALLSLMLEKNDVKKFPVIWAARGCTAHGSTCEQTPFKIYCKMIICSGLRCVSCACRMQTAACTRKPDSEAVAFSNAQHCSRSSCICMCTACKHWPLLQQPVVGMKHHLSHIEPAGYCDSVVLYRHSQDVGKGNASQTFAFADVEKNLI